MKISAELSIPADGYECFWIKDEHGFDLGCINGPQTDTRKKLAERIVHAVNSHDDLQATISRLTAERDDLKHKLEFHQAWHWSYEEEAKALRAKLASAFEDAAKVAEAHGEPYALQAATGAMMFRAVTSKIAATIRALSTPAVSDAQSRGEQ